MITVIEFKKVYNPGPNILELCSVIVYTWLVISKAELDIQYKNFV